MSSMSGVSDLVAQIRATSQNIEQGDNKFGRRLDQIEKSINELFLKTGRPGGFGGSRDDDERADAAEMSHQVPGKIAEGRWHHHQGIRAVER